MGIQDGKAPNIRKSFLRKYPYALWETGKKKWLKKKTGKKGDGTALLAGFIYASD